jgi:hypothetical protein
VDDLSDDFYDHLSEDFFDVLSDDLSGEVYGDLTFLTTFLMTNFDNLFGDLSDDLSLVSEQASSSSPPVSCSSALFLNMKQTIDIE